MSYYPIPSNEKSREKKVIEIIFINEQRLNPANFSAEKKAIISGHSFRNGRKLRIYFH